MDQNTHNMIPCGYCRLQKDDMRDLLKKYADIQISLFYNLKVLRTMPLLFGKL